MKIRELLALTCVLLGKTDAEDYLEKGQCSNVVAAEEEIKYLLAAYESAMETAAAVEPLVAEYSAQNVKGISYNDMPGRVTAVLSVKEGQDRPVEYTLKMGRIELSDHKADVTVSYEYIPQGKTIDDDMDYREHHKHTPRVLSYLVAAEYLALKGSHILASVWLERYKNGIAACSKSLKGGVIKRRLWW